MSLLENDLKIFMHFSNEHPVLRVGRYVASWAFRTVLGSAFPEDIEAFSHAGGRRCRP